MANRLSKRSKRFPDFFKVYLPEYSFNTSIGCQKRTLIEEIKVENDEEEEEEKYQDDGNNSASDENNVEGEEEDEEDQRRVMVKGLQLGLEDLNQLMILKGNPYFAAKAGFGGSEEPEQARVEMAWKAYLPDGSSLLQDLVGEDGICIWELPKRGQKQDIMLVPFVYGVDSQSNSKSSRV